MQIKYTSYHSGLMIYHCTSLKKLYKFVVRYESLVTNDALHRLCKCFLDFHLQRLFLTVGYSRPPFRPVVNFIFIIHSVRLYGHLCDP